MPDEVKRPGDVADCPFARGDAVEKVGGDYQFVGNVVAVFEKLSGLTRVVVENAHGLLFIFNPSQLRRLPPDDEVAPH